MNSNNKLIYKYVVDDFTKVLNFITGEMSNSMPDYDSCKVSKQFLNSVKISNLLANPVIIAWSFECSAIS